MPHHAEKLLLAAIGYLELDMTDESLAELNALPADWQDRSDVLQVRLQACVGARRWQNGLDISRKLCGRQPDEAAGFIQAAVCLHELGRTVEAKQTLLTGPAALLREPTYHYNLGCYDAVLGNIEEAQSHLRASFKMDRKFREFAKTDPDLKAVRLLL